MRRRRCSRRQSLDEPEARGTRGVRGRSAMRSWSSTCSSAPHGASQRLLVRPRASTGRPGGALEGLTSSWCPCRRPSRSRPDVAPGRLGETRSRPSWRAVAVRRPWPSIAREPPARSVCEDDLGRRASSSMVTARRQEGEPELDLPVRRPCGNRRAGPESGGRSGTPRGAGPTKSRTGADTPCRTVLRRPRPELLEEQGRAIGRTEHQHGVDGGDVHALVEQVDGEDHTDVRCR